MLFPALVFHPQLVVRRCTEDVAGVVVPGDGVRGRRVVQRVRDVRQVNVAVAAGNGHFGPVGERRVPAQGIACGRLRHPQPQVAVTGFCPLPVEVQPDPVALVFIQVRVDVILFPTLNSYWKRSKDFRPGNFYRTEVDRKMALAFSC